MMTHNDNPGRGSGSENPDSVSTSLLDRVKAQEPEAWERLVELYGPVVYEWCRIGGLQAEDAADVFQEVFGAVASRVNEFCRDGQGTSFRGWLWTITRNKICDHFRHLQTSAQGQGGTAALQRLAAIPNAPPDSSQTGTHVAPVNAVEHRAMELVRASVEEQTWRAFLQLTLRGRSAADVAADLGMNVRAVYEAKYRVIRRIREEMRGLIEQPPCRWRLVVFSKVSDITPLVGAPLRSLNIGGIGSRITDVSALTGAPLEELGLSSENVVPKKTTKGMDAIRAIKSLQKINGISAADFWKEFDAQQEAPVTQNS